MFSNTIHHAIQSTPCHSWGTTHTISIQQKLRIRAKCAIPFWYKDRCIISIYSLSCFIPSNNNTSWLLFLSNRYSCLVFNQLFRLWLTLTNLFTHFNYIRLVLLYCCLCYSFVCYNNRSPLSNRFCCFQYSFLFFYNLTFFVLDYSSTSLKEIPIN